MSYLEHYTVETGHTCQSPRSEVSTALLELSRKLFDRVYRLGQTVPILMRWAMKGSSAKDGSRMVASLWYAGMDTEGPPTVRMSVDRREGQPPLIRASMAGVVLAQDPAQAAMDTGDMERLIAWAWIEGTGGLEGPGRRWGTDAEGSQR